METYKLCAALYNSLLKKNKGFIQPEDYKWIIGKERMRNLINYENVLKPYIEKLFFIPVEVTSEYPMKLELWENITNKL